MNKGPHLCKPPANTNVPMRSVVHRAAIARRGVVCKRRVSPLVSALATEVGSETRSRHKAYGNKLVPDEHGQVNAVGNQVTPQGVWKHDVREQVEDLFLRSEEH